MKLILTFLFLSARIILPAQESYKLGDEVSDFPIEKIINFKVEQSSFHEIRRDITIIDFFGTWCLPCRKAIPELIRLQDTYGNRVRVVLISIEEEQKLNNFISTQSGFSLPMIVDSKNLIVSGFEPPYYPYTVVVNKMGRIIAIPSYEQVTESSVAQWLNDQSLPNNKSDQPINTLQRESIDKMKANSTNQMVKLSQDFIYAAKTGDSVTQFVNQLARIKPDELLNQLPRDEEKMAFWINIYNGYTQVLLKNDADLYNQRNKFFSRKAINVAGWNFSLDQIEHGILRRSRIKWSHGHFSNPFASGREKKLRVEQPDYRIHFALNCGARSCPPIAFYESSTIHEQLQMATKAYLANEINYSKENNLLKLPAIMGWFRADFNGKKGMRKILRDLKLIPADSSPRIRFKKYNWDLYLDNYQP